MSERILAGQVASAGLAIGPLRLLARAAEAARPQGSPEEELAALRKAVAQAASELEALAEKADAMAADILSFQQALLEDEDLVHPILAEVAAGQAAAAAWRAALDREIAAYQEGEDEYFRARGADLGDLRDRVLRALAPQNAEADLASGILAAEDLTPTAFLEADWTHLQGAVLRGGSASSHVAMLARARGVPLLIGLGEGFDALTEGAAAILDAEQGLLILDPTPARLKAAERGRLAAVQRRRAAEHFALLPGRTATGESVAMLANVEDPDLLSGVDPAICDGVGLMRSEFLFQSHRAWPDEERQLAAYRRVLDWAAGRPVVVRTLDVGGDKPLEGLTPEGESNPFLGLRGLRLSLARPAVFRVQLRALARAALHGALKVMLPMVTHPSEMRVARDLFTEVVEELRREGVPARLPPLGMMVEVPAAALTAEDFAADFFSIGSNDLVQYVTATGRDNASVAALHDLRHPAVLALIQQVVEAGRRMKVEVSLCGDAAGDPALIPLLLQAGVRALSMAPRRLPEAKAAVAAWPPSRERRHG